jgi:hypothetical protein
VTNPSWDVPFPDQTILSTCAVSQSSLIPLTITSSLLFSPVTFDSDAPTLDLPPTDSPSPVTPLLHPSPDPSLIPLPDSPPDPPPIRRSDYITACSLSRMTVLFTEFSKISHSYKLLLLSVPDSFLPVDYILSTIADGSLEPNLNTGDDLS